MTGIAVWRDGPADAATNMAADECLAAAAVARGGLVVRLYGWSSTAISLGAFQTIAEARGCQAIAGLPLVRRPSGGGAIVHGSDLTYAAAVPKDHPWGAAPQTFYDAIHVAWVEILRHRGVPARLAKPDPAVEASFFCFERRAGGDVVVDLDAGDAGRPNAKLMGSAQRRLAAAVLQHGSLLLRSNRDVGPAGRHPGLEDLPGTNWADDEGCRAAVDDWLGLVARSLGQSLDHQAEPFLSTQPPGFAAARERFAGDRWTSRR